MKLEIVCLLSSMLFLGCSSEQRENKQELRKRQISGQEYVVIDGASLDSDAKELTGPGSLVFLQPLGAIDANKNYALVFSLEDGGSLRLESHADRYLKKGVGLSFERSGKELSLTLLVQGGKSESKILAGVDARFEMSLSIDVHNAEDPSHVLVWSGAEKTPDDDNALFNSDADAQAPGRGAGTFWGLVLGKATVKAAQSAGARFAD